MRYLLLGVVVVFAVLGVVGAAQMPTVPELIRRNDSKPLHRIRSVEIVTAELRELISDSELVVHGTITPPRTYLSSDQRDVLTDYLITPQRILLQRVMQAGEKPGAPSPIILTRWGGSTTIDGVPVTFELRNVPPLNNGGEYVLFLRRSPYAEKAFIEVNSFAATLGVRNSRIEIIGKPGFQAASITQLSAVPVNALADLITGNAR